MVREGGFNETWSWYLRRVQKEKITGATLAENSGPHKYNSSWKATGLPSVEHLSVLCDKTVNKSKGPLLSMWPLANLGWSRHWPYNPSLAPRRDQHCIKSTQGYLITNVRLQRLVFLRRKVTSFISHFLIYFGWLFTLHGPIITLNGRDGGSIIVNWSPLSPQWSTDPSPFFPPVSANSRTFASINSICFYPVNL